MPSLPSSSPPSASAPSRLPLLEPYTAYPTVTLLFFNSHAKGNYFLPDSIQQLLTILDGLLLLALPLYVTGVTYNWSYRQSTIGANSGGEALSAMFDTACGVLQFTVVIAYLVILLALLSVRPSLTALIRSSASRREWLFRGCFCLSDVWCAAVGCAVKHQARHALIPQVVVSTLAFTYLVSAMVLIVVSVSAYSQRHKRCTQTTNTTTSRLTVLYGVCT